MSASADLQLRVCDLLRRAGALRVVVPIVDRRTKELAKEIEANAANKGLCLWVMPPLPTRAMQGVPFVFFEGAEIRVRIVEQPAVSARFGADGYDLLDDVATALQWQPHRGIEEAVAARMLADSIDHAAALALVRAEPEFAELFALAAILAHPLELASRPAEEVADPKTRIIDVIFNAVYQLNPTSAES